MCQSKFLLNEFWRIIFENNVYTVIYTYLIIHFENRFALHSTFMFFIYNVIRICQFWFENSLLSKRKYWFEAQKNIKNLIVKKLQRIAKMTSRYQSIDNSIIKKFLQQISVIENFVSFFYFAKFQNRADIKKFIVRRDMNAIWITLNSSNFSHFLMLKLADTDVTNQLNDKTIKFFKKQTTSFNFVTVAQFFDHICINLFQNFIRCDQNENDIFGHVSDYFDVIKTNDRNMFHLYCLIWLIENNEFVNLKNKIQKNVVFRLISWTQS